MYSDEKVFVAFINACGGAQVTPFVRKGDKSTMLRFKQC
jgi:hypothetical protein